MKPTSDLIGGLGDRFSHAVIAYVDSDGYPMSVATEFEVDPQSGTVLLRAPAGEAHLPDPNGGIGLPRSTRKPVLPISRGRLGKNRQPFVSIHGHTS